MVDSAPDLLARGQLDLVITSARLPEELLSRCPFMSVDYVALAAAYTRRAAGPARQWLADVVVEMLSARRFR